VEVFRAHEVAKNRLILSAGQAHLTNGGFDIDLMLKGLENLLKNALRDRYKGLWAVGDMTWELGMERDPARLLEYEWRLEKMFHQHPVLSGICQYHADTLPRSFTAPKPARSPIDLCQPDALTHQRALPLYRRARQRAGSQRQSRRSRHQTLRFRRVQSGIS
jgi:MEDS: MEthanogen/methylotroph, DcmR Sensory domain